MHLGCRGIALDPYEACKALMELGSGGVPGPGALSQSATQRRVSRSSAGTSPPDATTPAMVKSINVSE